MKSLLQESLLFLISVVKSDGHRGFRDARLSVLVDQSLDRVASIADD